MTIYGSLFSGVGGLDLAIEALFDAAPVFHCETDPAAGRVLEARWPGVPNLGDIQSVDFSVFRKNRATKSVPISIFQNFQPFILAGGFPCQDVSCGGPRAGLGGARSGLWAEFARAIDESRPDLVVIENVKGLLSVTAQRTNNPVESRYRNVGVPNLRAMGAVVGDLSDLGYDARWTTLAAASVGAPHRRERVFILATPRDATHAPTLCPASMDGLFAIPAGPIRMLPTPQARDHKGPFPGHRQGGRDLPAEILKLLPTPGVADAVRGPDYARAGRSGSGGDDLITICCKAFRGRGAEWGEYGAAIKRWEKLYGPAPSPVEPNQRGTGIRLAPEFSEWMMGWPAGWVTDFKQDLTRRAVLRLIGNGCVPQQAYTALAHLGRGLGAAAQSTTPSGKRRVTK